MMEKANFNELELLTIAMALEDQGMKFYQNGAKNTEGQLRQFLLDAAQQEKEHKEVFQGFYDNIVKNKPQNEDDYLFDPEVASYLKALTEKAVFDRTPFDSEEAFKDLKGSVSYALKSEELTVDIYSKLYESAKRQDVKDLLKKLIKEEKGHAKYFEKILKSL
ncbi:MAG TPA: ferritin family protein [Bacillota bacterium]|jgi:rubrerythrin|nr:ferritin family protein [Bacillota bacterium]